MNPSLTNFRTKQYDLTLSVDTNAYASGDVLAAAQELALVSGRTDQPIRGRITSVVVLDPDDQGAAFDLVFAGEEFALGAAENAALAISDAEAQKLAGIVPVSAYSDLVNSQLARPSFDPVEVTIDSGSLWVGAIARATATYAGGEIHLKIFVQFDNLGVV